MSYFKVRYGAFETNSSSMHSLVITRNDGKYTHDEASDGMYPSDGVWKIYSKDELNFERAPFDVLDTFEGKTRYAIAEFCGCAGDEQSVEQEFAKIEGIVTSMLPEVTEIELPEQHESFFYTKDRRPLKWNEYKYDRKAHDYFYTDENGDKQPVEEIVKTSPYYGYIDHQSLGLLSNFLKKKDITLEEFLTNKRYVVIVDGDEYETWEHIKQAGLVSGNVIYDTLDDKSPDAPVGIEDAEYLRKAQEVLDECDKQEQEKSQSDE